MRHLRCLAIAAALACTSACGLEEAGERLLESAQPIPIPEDKAAYVGTWEGPGMQLTIRADGMVSYRREVGSGSRRLEAPIRAFSGHDFEVGLGSLTTTFEVSDPPHERDGTWLMTVDGVDLERIADAPAPPDTPWSEPEEEGTRV